MSECISCSLKEGTHQYCRSHIVCCLSALLACPACCGHPESEWWGEKAGTVRQTGQRRNWGSHDPGSPWSCHTQHPAPVSTPPVSTAPLCSSKTHYDDRSDRENTPVLSLYTAATINQSEAGGLWLMVRPGYLTNGSPHRIFSSGPVNSVIVLKC